MSVLRTILRHNAPTGEPLSPGNGGSAPAHEPVSEPEALQAFLRNVLFFAHDPELVDKVFQNAFDFISRVPVYRLTFVPDAKVWELIGGD